MESAGFAFRSRRAPVYGARGMVATTQPLASEAGLRVLQQGGTAADACVAAAAALNVTEPCNTGLGGDAFALFYEAKTKKVQCLQGCGRSPAALTLERMRAHPDVQGTELSPLSALCVTVPGTAAAWEAANQRWGVKKLSEVLAPAIELAEEGFPVSLGAAEIWKHSEDLLRGAERGQQSPFLPKRRTPAAGEIFRNPDLARTLRLLGEKGAKEGFYTGEVAREIVKAITSRGGVMTEEDLAKHSSSFVEPISSCFRGRYRLYECPPPTQGVTALMALNLLEQLPVQPQLSAQALHAQAEALRFAFADALQFCADPSAGAGVEGLLDKERARKRWKMFHPEARAVGVAPDLEGLRMGPDTVYLAAVDRWGNACSFINSNYMGFGTGIVPDNCGFTLQNRGHNFILEESHPNCIGPSKFCYHTIIPGLVTHEDTGELFCTLGVMGGFMQPQGHLQVLCGMADYGLDPQAALDQPRFCLQGVDSAQGARSADLAKLLVEEGIADETQASLRSLGHDVVLVRGWQRLVFGRGQVISRDPESGVLCGGTEPRADGSVLAW